MKKCEQRHKTTPTHIRSQKKKNKKYGMICIGTKTLMEASEEKKITFDELDMTVCIV